MNISEVIIVLFITTLTIIFAFILIMIALSYGIMLLIKSVMDDSIVSPYGYVISKAEIKRQMDYGLSYDEAIDWIESELQVNEILGGIMGD